MIGSASPRLSMKSAPASYPRWFLDSGPRCYQQDSPSHLEVQCTSACLNIIAPCNAHDAVGAMHLYASLPAGGTPSPRKHLPSKLHIRFVPVILKAEESGPAPHAYPVLSRLDYLEEDEIPSLFLPPYTYRNIDRRAPQMTVKRPLSFQERIAQIIDAEVAAITQQCAKRPRPMGAIEVR